VDLRLAGKVILVAGGATEIGASIGRACVNEGAIPVMVSGDSEVGEKIRKELRDDGTAGTFITADLSSASGHAQAVHECVQAFGRIDALVNYAGGSDEALESRNPADFVDSLSRYLAHYYSMAHYALPHLKQSKGAIVNVVVKTNMPGQGAVYLCAKGAIQALTREWAAELLPCGIRVTTMIPDESEPKRSTKAEEVAAATLFLISPESAHTTGQHLDMNIQYTQRA
jgi:L-fucose dehydrogenase